METAQFFERQLTSALDKLRTTADTLEQVRTTVAPHPVAINEVKLCDGCRGLGCILCRDQGYVQASGAPLTTSPTATRPDQAAQAIATHVPSRAEMDKAKRELLALSRVFREAATLLGRSQRKAKQLADLFQVLGS